MTSVLVVGAGIFGVTGALALAERGHRVTLVDPGPIPHPDAASTDISKFVRADYGSDAFYTALMEEALAGWKAWNASFDRPLFHRSGLLVLAGGPMRPGGFEHDSHALLTARGHALQRLDPDALRARFPAFDPEAFPDGYFNPGSGWAESGAVVAALVARARAAGVEVREGVRVAAVEAGPRAVATDGTRLDAGVIVVAAGAFTPSLLPELSAVLSIVGQPVLHFRVQDPARFQPPVFPCFAADTGHTGFYGFPARDDGILKIANHGAGTPLDPAGPRVVDPAWEGRFRAFLRRAIPDLAGAPLAATRLCPYCDTPDGDLWIDRHPDRPGVVVATGGSGHGFKFAPVLGDLIAAAVEDRDDPRLRRFRWRETGPRRAEAARHLGD